MASATKKQRKPSVKAAKPARRSEVKRTGSRSRSRSDAAPGLDDITGPDRSAPALAEVDGEVLEFIDAIDRFKKQHGRPFPSWSEVLLIVRQLGYSRS